MLCDALADAAARCRRDAALTACEPSGNCEAAERMAGGFRRRPQILPLINRDGTSYLPDTTTSAPYARNKSRVGTGASCPYTTYSAWGIHSNFSGLAWTESCSLSKVLCSSSLARAECSELHNSVSTGGSHMAAWRSRATLVTRAILQRMNTNMLDGVSHISLCESVIFALVG